MTELTRGKSLVVLAIVIGCFAILWPKIFYPMFQGPVTPTTTTPPTHPPFRERQPGALCCGLVFENDVSSAAFLAELCSAVLKRGEQPATSAPPELLAIHLTDPVFNECRRDLLDKCAIDLDDIVKSDVDGAVADRRVAIKFHGKVRAKNLTTCLLANYDIDENLVRAKKSYHRPQDIFYPRHMRPERPPHLNPDGVHPALREKGRVIPPARTIEKQAKPGPMPGMRPPMGAGGHVVSPPSGTGSMGILMPIYTIGIVVFFVYTLMKIMLKKQPESTEPRIKDFHMDPEHRKYLFAEDYCRVPGSDGRPTDIHVKEYALLQEQQQRLVQLEQQLRRSRSRTPPETFANKEERVEDLQTIPEHVCTHHAEEAAADAQTVESAPTDEPTRDEARIEEVVEEPIVKAETAPVEAPEPAEKHEPVEVEEVEEVETVEPEQAAEEENEEDEEVDQLRRRLEETEKAMERICRQMGNVTDKLLPTAVAELFTEQLQQAEKQEVEASVVEEPASEIVEQEAVVEEAKPVEAAKKEETEWDNVLAKVEESFRRFSRDIGQPPVEMQQQEEVGEEQAEEPEELTDEQAIAECLRADEIKPTSFAEMIAKAHDDEPVVEEVVSSSTVAEIESSKPQSVQCEYEDIDVKAEAAEELAAPAIEEVKETIEEEVREETVEEQAPVAEEQYQEKEFTEETSSNEVVQEQVPEEVRLEEESKEEVAHEVSDVTISNEESSQVQEEIVEATELAQVESAQEECDVTIRKEERSPVQEQDVEVTKSTQVESALEECDVTSSNEESTIPEQVSESVESVPVTEEAVAESLNNESQLEAMLEAEAQKVIETIEESSEPEKAEQVQDVIEESVQSSPVEEGSVQEPVAVEPITEESTVESSPSAEEIGVYEETASELAQETPVTVEESTNEALSCVEENVAQEQTNEIVEEAPVVAEPAVEPKASAEETSVLEETGSEIAEVTPVTAEESITEAPSCVEVTVAHEQTSGTVEETPAVEEPIVESSPSAEETKVLEEAASEVVEATPIAAEESTTEALSCVELTIAHEQTNGTVEEAPVVEELIVQSSPGAEEKNVLEETITEVVEVEPVSIIEVSITEAPNCVEETIAHEQTIETVEEAPLAEEPIVESHSATVEEPSVQQSASEAIESDVKSEEPSVEELNAQEQVSVPEDVTIASEESAMEVIADSTVVAESTVEAPIEEPSTQEPTIETEPQTETVVEESPSHEEVINETVDSLPVTEEIESSSSCPVHEESIIQQTGAETETAQPVAEEPNEEASFTEAEKCDEVEKPSEVVEPLVHPEVVRCALYDQPRSSSEERKLIVCGMEFTAEMEDHGKMPAELRPRVTPDRHHTKTESEIIEPESIPSVLLETTIPAESHLVVSEAECSAEVVPPEQLDLDETEYETSPVVLSGKMTLSVIGMELTAEAPDVHAEAYTVEEPESHRSVRFPPQPTDKVYLIPSEPDEESSEIVDEVPRTAEPDEDEKLEEPLEEKIVYRPPTPPLHHIDEDGLNVEFLTYEQLEEAGEIAEIETADPYYATSTAEAVQEEIQESYEAVTNYTSTAQPFFVDSGLETVAEEPEELEKPEEASDQKESKVEDQETQTTEGLCEPKEAYVQGPFEPETVSNETANEHLTVECDTERATETVEFPIVSLTQVVDNADAISQSLAERILMDVEYQVLATSESSSSVGTRRESNDSATVQDVSKAEEPDFESNRELPEIEHSLEQVESSGEAGEAEPSISSFIIREDYPDEEAVQAMTEDEILQARKEIEAIKKLLADVTSSVTDGSESGAADDQASIVNELAHAMADDGAPTTASKGSSPDMDEFEVIRSSESAPVESLGSKLPPTSES